MAEETPVSQIVLELMRDVHVIKSALYLDTSIVGNLNVTRQIARLNELTEKLIELYKVTSGVEPPTPSSVLKPVAPGTLKNFDSRKVKKAQEAARARAAKTPADPDKVSEKKKKEERIANKLKDLNKQARRKQQRRYDKTKKVRGARKGNPPSSSI